MGKLKQLHIDCERGKPCLAPEYASTCYMGGSTTEPDEDPREPGEPIDGGDRDPQFDQDRE